MGKLKVKVESVDTKTPKKCYVEFKLGSKSLAKTNSINTNKKVVETTFNEVHTLDINETDELSVELSGFGTAIFPVSLLKLKKGEEKKHPIKLDGAELHLTWTALDFGIAPATPKKAPPPKNYGALPQMPDAAEVERQFVDVARNANLKPEKIAQMDLQQKWMLILGAKSQTQAEGQEAKPGFWVTKLKHDANPGTLSEVIFHVKSKGIDWLQEFNKLGGIAMLADMLDDRLKKKSRDETDTAMIKKIIVAISSVMNNVKGFELVLKAVRPIQILALSMNDPALDDETVVIVIKLLAAACMVSGGHKTVMKAMTKYAYIKREKARFETLVKALEKAEKSQNRQVIVTYLALINVLINQPQHDYLFKRRIRGEFEALGLSPILEKLSQIDIEVAPDIDNQLVLYEQQKEADEKSHQEHFGHVDEDVSNIHFTDLDFLYNRLKAEAEQHSITPYLKEMLVDVLAIHPASQKGTVKWELVNHFARQVSLNSDWIGELDYDSFLTEEEAFSDSFLKRSIALEDLLANMRQYEINDVLPLRQTLEAEEQKHQQAVKAYKTKLIELENSVKLLAEADEQTAAATAEVKAVEEDLSAGTPRAADTENKAMRQTVLDTETSIKDITTTLHKLDSKLTDSTARAENYREAGENQTKTLQELEDELRALKVQLPAEGSEDEKKVYTQADVNVLSRQKKDLEISIADLAFSNQSMDSAVVQARITDRKSLVASFDAQIVESKRLIATGNKPHSGKLPVDAEIEKFQQENAKYSTELPKVTKEVETWQAKVEQLKKDLVAAEQNPGGAVGASAPSGGAMARGGPPPPGGGGMARGGPPPPPGGGMARGGPPPPPGEGGPPPPPGGGMARGGPPPPPGGGMARGGPPPPGGGGPPPPPGRGGPPPPPGGRGGPPPPPGGRGGPPPPPGGRGGPPGPPGPPGRGGPGRGRGAAAAFVPKFDPPTEKVKAFNWVKMPNLKIEGTVFEKLSDITPGLVDFKLLESCFAVKEKEKKEVEAKPTGPPKPVIAVFLDPKIAQNINIWLSKYKAQGNAAIIKAAKDIDAKFFGQDPSAAVNSLKAFVPSTDEIEQINEYLSAGPPNEWKLLGTAEQFAHEFAKVPNLANRLQCFQYMVDFPSKKDDLAPDVKTLLQVSKYVAEDEKIIKFLEIVLHVGNFLNAGNKRLEKAGGFSFDTFAQLHNTKTSDNKSTIFDVIVDMIREQKPELCNYPQPEADLVQAGARLNLQNSETELRNLRKGLDKTAALVPEIPPQDDEDKFQSVISEFIKTSTQELEAIEKEFTDAQQAFESVVSQFGEDPKKTAPEDFFATWVTFVTKIQESNVRFAKQKEAEEKQKKRDEAAAKKAPAGATRGGMMGALAAEAASRGAARGTRGTRGTARGGGTAPPAEATPAEPVNPFAGALRGRGTRGRGGAASKMVADSLFDDLTAGNVFKK